MNPNITLKIAINSQEKKINEEKREKDATPQIQNNEQNGSKNIHSDN